MQSPRMWTVWVETADMRGRWEVIADGDWLEGQKPRVFGAQLPLGLLEDFAETYPPGAIPAHSQRGSWLHVEPGGETYLIGYKAPADSKPH